MTHRLENAFRFLVLLGCLLSTQLIAATPESGPEVTEGYVNAPIATVWELFTTPAGYAVLGMPQAEVDLRLGGLIRSRASATGSLGDPDTLIAEILAYEPERLLALRIRQAPAGYPHREAIAGLWTVIHFTPSGTDMTHVRIVGLGYRDDPPSQALRKFFAEANRGLLDQAAKKYWPKCKLCAAEPSSAAE